MTGPLRSLLVSLVFVCSAAEDLQIPLLRLIMPYGTVSALIDAIAGMACA
jgi:hypothetical protein